MLLLMMPSGAVVGGRVLQVGTVTIDPQQLPPLLLLWGQLSRNLGFSATPDP